MAATVSVLIFLACFCFLHQAARSTLLLRTSHGLPAKAFCSRTCEKTEEQPAAENFPLYECSCSRSCSVYGDCCYDSPYKNTTVGHKTDFICVAIIGHGRYRAVAGCPPDQHSDFCKDGLGHLPPVTSRVTNVTYANRFCAICNGEEANLVTWNVELRCNTDMNDGIENSSEAATKYIYHSGDFWSLNEDDGSKTLCMFHVHFNDTSFMKGLELKPCTKIRTISDCSASWRDLSVLKMCRSYEDPVYFHDTGYRNVHCAECNYLNPTFADCIPFHVKFMSQMGLIDSSVNHFCRTRGYDACIQALSHKGRPYSISLLFNIHEKACVPPKGKKCCEGHKFDYRSKSCRKVRN